MSLQTPQESTASKNSSGSGSVLFLTGADFSLEVAMGLYGLRHMEMIHELQRDTVALLGWGPNTVVLTFRGTTTLKNVFTDLQVQLCVPVLHCRSSPHSGCLCLLSGMYHEWDAAYSGIIEFALD